MTTIDYLFGPLSEQFLPGVVTALLIAMTASLLSPLVVLRRLAFVGQGISHAAFAGVGAALVLGFGTATIGDRIGFTLAVLGSALVSSLLIAWLARPRSEGRTTSGDAAIGIVLAGAMAIGFLLYRVAVDRFAAGTGPRPPELHAVLFGDVLFASWTDALIAGGLLIGTAATLWLTRRRLIFWGFDTPAATAVGIDAQKTERILLVLLAIAVVVAVRLAGIVLVTAFFVIPGAAALQATRRLAPTWMLSAIIALVATAAGLVLAFEADWSAGPSIVVVLVVCYSVAAMLPSARAA